MGKTNKVSYNAFDELAQKVWAAKSIEAKREELHKMVNEFKFKDKQESYHQHVDTETSEKKLDMLAANFLHVGYGDRVIK